MFSVQIDEDVIKEVEDFMSPDNEENLIAKNMNDNGLSIMAMAFVINSIFEAINDAKKKLGGDSSETTINSDN